MRRKSDKEIGKEFRVFFILGTVAILFGLFVILIPLIPITPYEEYQEKEVVISKFDHFYGVRTSSYDYITTEEGESFNITGDYNRSELSEILIKGTVAVIKYDTNNIFPFKKYVEEMIVDGNKIVTYDNDTPIDWNPYIIACSLCSFIGVCFLFLYYWQIIENRKLQAKRDEKIIKKYGSLKK